MIGYKVLQKDLSGLLFERFTLSKIIMEGFTWFESIIDGSTFTFQIHVDWLELLFLQLKSEGGWGRHKRRVCVCVKEGGGEGVWEAG